MSIAAAGGSGRIWQERVLVYGLALLVGILSLLPLARLLIEALVQKGGLSLTATQAVLSSGATWTAFRNSLETALGGTFIAVAIGTAVALVVTLTDMRARAAFVFCFVLPLMIAPQV